MRLAALVVLASLSSGVAAKAPEPDIKPGYWEITASAWLNFGTTIPSGDDGEAPTVETTKRCLTAEIIEQDFVDAFADAKPGCKTTLHEQSRRRLHGSQRCSEVVDDMKVETRIEQDTRFEGERLYLEVTATSTGLLPMSMRARSEGRYLGACPAD